ncbi:MAG: 3-dehydroquinate synthase [Elusimicrobia bacterium RIFCSPLOWO2_01_FULL_54_10]|nr:MAG: 3-dehydroquinate synthase [Elusimicrobia bacterium RIFCSPLOWO2_01_FULL_54_10]
MKAIPVRLKRAPYSIAIGSDFGPLGAAVSKFAPSKTALIVTHPGLRTRFGSAVQKSLSRAGIRSQFCLIPESEKSKSLKTVEVIYRACVAARLDRGSCMIALGGGVVGDIAGFAAATYLRGISLIQAPTTLLAMVDSSIGGKTGVDLKEAKNYAGAFHQPRLVWINMATLKTLPIREIVNGMAEVIKYGVIADSKLFAALEASAPLSRIIPVCAAIKARVVAADETETRGLREILNFGHTWGHAFETFGNYRAYSHGQAVSIGMCAAGWMARRLGLWKSGDQARMGILLAGSGLPIKLSRRVPEKALFEILLRDKKVRQSKPRFVLPVRIGKVIVKNVSKEAALEGLKYVQP